MEKGKKKEKVMEESEKKKDNFFGWAFRKWYFWLILFVKNLDAILQFIRKEIGVLDWIAMLGADFFLIFILFGLIHFLFSIFKKKKKDKKEED